MTVHNHESHEPQQLHHIFIFFTTGNASFEMGLGAFQPLYHWNVTKTIALYVSAGQFGCAASFGYKPPGFSFR